MAQATKKTLSPKESTLFKELLNLYETRQLKKGVKTADQILKKVPDHGETLCMKGLLYTHMGNREEGLDLVKKGIRFDLTSHICWHVYGLIQKGKKDYEGALKSYTQALRFDKENLNLLNDAANLQAQLRQFEALQDTRELILKLRPNARKNWVSLAVAYHLNGNLSSAKTVLENYVRIVKNVPDYDFEHSELILYNIRVLEELGELDEALAMLDNNAKSRVIVDRIAVMEMRGRLLSKLNNTSEAEETWRSLIQKNPECYDYYRELFKVKESVPDETCETIVQTLQEFSEQHPRATAPRRIALTVSSGDVFKIRVREYILGGIRRGIPSLFADIKSLYKDAAKQQIIEEVVNEFKDAYAPQPVADSDSVNGKCTSLSEPPTTYLWILYFLAQHHSHLQHYTLALSIVDAAILYTPTLPELHTCKGRLLKRAGDFVGAVQCIEGARKLDEQDRFLNTKSAKYHMRVGLLDQAQSLLGLFTKQDAASPGADLEDMQSLLYLTEEADAHNRLGRLGPALKKYMTVRKVFDDFYDDQYDFHFYALRRFTLNSYIKLFEWEDSLQFHPALIKAILEAARIYVRVHDDPKLATSTSTIHSEAEKKARKKAKKAAKREETKKDKATSTNTSVSNEDKGIEPPTPKDEDPDGAKELAASDGIEQAWKLLKPLLTQPVTRVDVCTVIYDVSVRRQKYLQASKALLTARSLDSEDPELHVRLIDFRQRVSSLDQPLAQPLDAVVTSALSELLPADIALDTFNSQYLQRHSISALATLAAAKVLLKLNASLDEVESTVLGMLSPESVLDIKARRDSILDGLQALQFLTEIQSSRADEFRTKCDERFELSTVFKTPEELAALQPKALTGVNGVKADDNEKQEVP